ncbi:MAG: TraM recognition domain-containing protein [Bacteroidota bacterium]
MSSNLKFACLQLFGSAEVIPLILVLLAVALAVYFVNQNKAEKKKLTSAISKSMNSNFEDNSDNESFPQDNSSVAENGINGLDTPLIKFSKSERKDWWTIRDAVRGTQIFGGIGSGKSSGSGKMIAKSFLKNGFGGLVLCAKPDEKNNWIDMAVSMGRADDIIVFGEHSKYQFNPLQYELQREGKGAGEVINLSNMFMAIYKMGNRLSGGGSGGGSNERFWDNALRRCLNRMIQLLNLSGRELSIANMRRMISTVPMDHEAQKVDEMSDEELEEWGKRNFCVDCILDAGDRVGDDEELEQEYYLVYDYFLREFPSLPAETRPSIVESFLGIAEAFTSGILKRHFSNDVNLFPEETHKGKIIILNFPVKEYLDAGVYAQGIYKLIWQQATERRTVTEDTKPVFLWVDEAQLFLSDYDQIFQTTARSSKACTVFISQNISNYYVSIGGNNPKPKADSLLGNLGTKIFHSNNDTVTNQWASSTIGKAFREMESVNVGKDASFGLSSQFHWQVEPREFTTLASGAAENDFKVEGIITIAGREWSNGKNYIRRKFSQKS